MEYGYHGDTFGTMSVSDSDQLHVVYEDFFYDAMHRATDIVMTIDKASGPPIPTAGTWGLVAMVLLLVTVASLLFQRRQTGPA